MSGIGIGLGRRNPQRIGMEIALVEEARDDEISIFGSTNHPSVHPQHYGTHPFELQLNMQRDGMCQLWLD